jgi:phosphoribosylformylglycinamidine cyclo-ligase
VKPLLRLAAAVDLHGLAHITGGGLTDNIPRVLPDGLGVELEARAWRRDALWDWIQRTGRIADAEMHRTFNCGIGMVAIVPRAEADAALAPLASAGEQANLIGEVVAGAGVRIS